MGIMMLMMAIGLNHIVILNIWDVNYRCIISGISKSGAAKKWVKRL